jgi:hypothetical protein
MCNIAPLTKNCGANNPPGTRTKLYLAPSGEFNGWPQTAADGGGTDPGDSLILDEPFDFTTAPVGAGYWREVDIVADTGEIRDTLVGEVGGRSWENMFAFFLSGLEAERLEFAKNMANCCIVALLQDRNGVYRVIGRFDDPAFIESIELTTGLKSGDRRGGAYVIKWSSGSPTSVYDAETHGIELTPNS